MRWRIKRKLDSRETENSSLLIVLFFFSSLQFFHCIVISNGNILSKSQLFEGLRKWEKLRFVVLFQLWQCLLWRRSDLFNSLSLCLSRLFTAVNWKLNHSLHHSGMNRTEKYIHCIWIIAIHYNSFQFGVRFVFMFQFLCRFLLVYWCMCLWFHSFFVTIFFLLLLFIPKCIVGLATSILVALWIKIISIIKFMMFCILP